MRKLELGFAGARGGQGIIAGGILLFLIAIDMLFARRPGTKQTDAEEREAAQIENPAVFPLAVGRLIAGNVAVYQVSGCCVIDCQSSDQRTVLRPSGVHSASHSS